MGNFISTKNNDFRLLILGIDYCGKKKILYRIKENKDVPTFPSKGLFIEDTQFILDNGTLNNLHLIVVCGQNKIRPLWGGIYKDSCANGLIFVIDSNDRERINEVKEEIHILNSNQNFMDHPFLFLSKKSDLPNSMKSEELISILELNKLDSKRKWNIIDTNALIDIKKGGIDKGLIWLLDSIKR